jgi:hypothetical protein
MGRFARHLFTLCSAVSLLLFVAACVLWARSYQRQGWVHWTQNGFSRCYALSLGSFPGRLSVGIEWQAADAKPLQHYDFIRPPMSAQPGFSSWSGDTPRSTDVYDAYAMTLPQRPDLHQFAGLAWYADQSYTSSWNLLVPHRYVVVVASALPLCWVWLSYRAMRRARRNTCPVCGYDLRASPERCPECGTATT